MLAVIYNLGLIYYDYSKFEKSEIMWNYTLEKNKKALWPEYPTTLTVIQNLEKFYYSCRKPDKARSI